MENLILSIVDHIFIIISEIVKLFLKMMTRVLVLLFIFKYDDIIAIRDE